MTKIFDYEIGGMKPFYGIYSSCLENGIATRAICKSLKLKTYDIFHPTYYDPYFLELWQQFEFENHSDYYSSNDLDGDEIKKPDDYNPIHLDFGFMYAVNESFRFGMHFQKPFVAFYWKL